MNKRIFLTVMAVALGAAVLESPARLLNAYEDQSADVSLLTWSDPVPWRFGAVYTRVTRPVEAGGVEVDLKADVVDGAVGVAPLPWMLLYGQVGASRAQLDGWLDEPADFGAGGLLGMKLNLWELDEGEDLSAWRVTVQLAGQYAYRTTDGSDRFGELEWSEAMAFLPVTYHLFFARSSRNEFIGDFYSVALYAGPAWSQVDGTWRWKGVEQDFEEAQSFGAVVGGDLWLLSNLSFGARADWFEGVGFQLSVDYRF